jgi:hypothetical protein
MSDLSPLCAQKRTLISHCSPALTCECAPISQPPDRQRLLAGAGRPACNRFLKCGVDLRLCHPPPVDHGPDRPNPARPVLYGHLIFASRRLREFGQAAARVDDHAHQRPCHAPLTVIGDGTSILPTRVQNELESLTLWKRSAECSTKATVESHGGRGYTLIVPACRQM